MSATQHPILKRLSDSDLMLADAHEDIRGRKVLDRNREEIGEVDDLIIDEADRKVRFLRVASGGFLGLGATKFLIPAEAIQRTDDKHVHVDRTRQNVAGAPAYDPDLVDEQYYQTLYGYYGYPPYWTPADAYRYPVI